MSQSISSSKQLSEENYQDIKEALEYQIDIVLRLEEERLILIKESKFQKQKIKELQDTLQKQQNKSVEKRDAQTQASIHVDSYGANASTQTDMESKQMNTIMEMRFTEVDEYMGDSVLQYSQNQSIVTLEDDIDDFTTSVSSNQEGKKKETCELFQQAHLLLKKSEEKIQNFEDQHSSKKRKPNMKNMPVKNLSFKKKEVNSLQSSQHSEKQIVPEKENTSFSLNTEKKKDQNEIITLELVKLTRENNSMKKEMQKIQDLSKKQIKDNADMKRMLEVKNEMLEKLRVEVAELSLVLNNDKSKSIRTIEGEFKKQKQTNSDLKREYEKVFEEKNELKEELSQFKVILSKLSEEYEKINAKSGENEKEENIKLIERITDLERQIKFRSDQITIKDASVKESQIENQKLLEEIEYYKHISMKSKEYAHKAIQDIDFYRSILKQHNISLS